MLNKNNKLTKCIGELIEISAKTALSAIPIGGTLITSVWDSVKSNCAQHRLEQWMNMIEYRLSKLEITLEEISNNDKFTTALFHATESAIKTAELEKREYLANAVLNSINCNVEESVMMMFMNMVDRYTVWHINILCYFENPKHFFNNETPCFSMGSTKSLLYEAFPNLCDNEQIVDIILKELQNDGMLLNCNFNATMTERGMLDSRTSELGAQFIKFLS